MKILKHRVQCPYGEVDIIAQKENKIYLFEVKSLHNNWMAFSRLNKSQIKRFIQNKMWLQNQYKKFQADCYIVFVGQKDELTFIKQSDFY